MSGVIKQSFSLNIKILSYFGLFPSENSTWLKSVQSYLFYFVFTYPVPILGSLHFLFENNLDPMRIGDNAFLVAETACQITKLLPFITNGNGIKKSMHLLEDSVFNTKNPEEKKILEKSIKTCQKMSMLFVISTIGGNFSWALKPLFSAERQLPVDVWLPQSPTENVKLYSSTYVLLVLGVAYVSIASSAIDPLISGLACLASGYVQILKFNLLHLNKFLTTSNSDIRCNIKQCVQLHEAILRFVKSYEQSFSVVVFSQFVGSVVVICFCCFHLSKVPPMTFQFATMVGYLTILLAQIYFYCYYGTILYHESNTLTNAVYMGEWYEYDIESKKDLVLLMERSKRPMIVTAGKILDLSVTTFATILRRSYSLLAFLNNK